MMQLSQVCAAVHGSMIGSDTLVQGVSTNSRDQCADRLFVALKGDNFDAHDFIKQAEQAGASAVMLERSVDTALPTVQVANTHKALTELATWWRSQFVIPVVGVTGSVGKTSVKDMLGCIFSELGSGVVTHGNLNNEIGVPLTLMRLSADDRYAIVEMGMNHAGEIARITRAARPTIALINNAAEAHLEGLGSVQAVAEAKGEIFEGLADDGVAIINHEDEYAEFWQNLVKTKRVITFGLTEGADVTASYSEQDQYIKLKVTAFEKRFSVKLRSLGVHSVRNALAATAVSLAANVPLKTIKSGLSAYRPAHGRLTANYVGSVRLLDDTYNANPASMQAAIKVLAGYSNNLLIVGDMAELGRSAKLAHSDIGGFARAQGINALYACGDYAEQVANAFGVGALAFANQDDLITYLKQTLPTGTVLVKGSRSARMERVVVALEEELRTAQVSHREDRPC